MFSSTGPIHYADDGWVFVYVDDELADYYYSLVPKTYRLTKSRRPAHVSVVRPEDKPTNLENWGKHEGETAHFIYNSDMFEDKGFWWLNLWSKEMEQIRSELGVGMRSRITIPPPGYIKTFHCTVGRVTER